VDSTIYRRGPDGKHVGIPELTATRIDESHFDYGDAEFASPISDAPSLAHEPPVDVYEATYGAPRTREAKPVREARPPKEPRAPREPKAKGKRNIFMRIFRVLRWVLAAYVIFFLSFGFWASGLLHKVTATPTHVVAKTAGQNWLLVGSDSRVGLSRRQQAQLHTGQSLGSDRTDTIMIVHFDSKGSPTLISLPRDSYVAIPKHNASDGTVSTMKHNKINAAYAIGGAPFLVKTVELNTGLHIDHFMEVGFAGIVDITNAVGGIHVCIPKNYDDKNSGLHVKKGCQTLNGKTALAYVRMRYADPTGDIGRIARQQQYIAAVLHKTVTPGVLLNPLSLIHLAKAGTAAVTVGERDSIVNVMRLGQAMRNLSKGKGHIMTVPVSNTNATTAVGSSVLWDTKKAHALFKSLGAK